MNFPLPINIWPSPRLLNCTAEVTAITVGISAAPALSELLRALARGQQERGSAGEREGGGHQQEAAPPRAKAARAGASTEATAAAAAAARDRGGGGRRERRLQD